jgi:hypothetical protein
MALTLELHEPKFHHSRLTQNNASLSCGYRVLNSSARTAKQTSRVFMTFHTKIPFNSSQSWLLHRLKPWHISIISALQMLITYARGDDPGLFVMPRVALFFAEVPLETLGLLFSLGTSYR